MERRNKRRAPSRPLLAKYRSQRRQSLPSEQLPASSSGRSRLRKASLFILALLPLTVGAWALSIVVPTAYAAWRASEDVFVDRADRPVLVDQATPAPTGMPESVQALLTATAEGTPASALSTPLPSGVPADNAGIPTPATIPPVAVDDESQTPPPLPTASGTPEPTSTPLPEWNGSDPIHVLLLGVDTRPSEETEGRSDTMIVVRVDPVEKRVDMFSIPRDLVVAIPGFSDGFKVNSAYPWGELYDIEGGGPALVAQTIELNFGVRIDYFATVDIPGLENVVDTIGGVIIDVDAQLKDDQYPTEDFGYTRAYFPSGIQRLNGKEAVQYARTRHSDGDFQRARRQQELLLAIRDQVLETGLITKLPQLIDDLADSIRTDLSPRQALSLASLAQEIDRANIWTHSLAPYTYPVVNDSGWFLYGDWDALRWVTQNLSEDPLAANLPAD